MPDFVFKVSNLKIQIKKSWVTASKCDKKQAETERVERVSSEGNFQAFILSI